MFHKQTVCAGASIFPHLPYKGYNKSHRTLQAASGADQLYLNQLLVQRRSAPLVPPCFLLLGLALRDNQQALPKKQSPWGQCPDRPEKHPWEHSPDLNPVPNTSRA